MNWELFDEHNPPPDGKYLVWPSQDGKYLVWCGGVCTALDEGDNMDSIRDGKWDNESYGYLPFPPYDRVRLYARIVNPVE